MRFQKFLETMNHSLVYNKNIQHRTLKYVINEFYKYLSNNEKDKYKFQVDLILMNTEKQLTIDTTLEKLKIIQLEQELNHLKNDLDPK